MTKLAVDELNQSIKCSKLVKLTQPDSLLFLNFIQEFVLLEDLNIA